MSSIEQSFEQSLWTFAVSETANEESETSLSPNIYPTRTAATQALWRKILVDYNSIHDSVIEFWKSIFDKEYNGVAILNNNVVYDESNTKSKNKYKLIRKLITPAMNTCIKEFCESKDAKMKHIGEYQSVLDSEFLNHFSSVSMTEEEIQYFVEKYSSYHWSSLSISWDIREVKLVQ